MGVVYIDFSLSDCGFLVSLIGFATSQLDIDLVCLSCCDNISVILFFFLLYDVVVFLLAKFSIAHSVYRSVMFWYFLFDVSPLL